MTETQNKGFGTQVPPLKRHVLIWFLHHGACESVAEDFFASYEACQWENAKGILIKNWKVRAWKWLWERKKP